MLFRMAWRNLWRNPRRTMIVLSATSIGVCGCFLTMAILFGMLAGMVETAISGGLGHVQVHAAGWDANPGLDLRLDDQGAEIEQALGDIDGVEASGPRVRSEGLAASPSASVGIAILGVDPESERGLSVASESLAEGVWLGEPNRVVLGFKLAERLEAEVGSKLVLSVQDVEGELTGRPYRVAGLIRAGSRALDDGVALMRLDDAQELFRLGDAISEIAIVTTDRNAADSIRQTLEERLPPGPEIRTWSQLEPVLLTLIDSFAAISWGLYAGIFIAMAFGIANVLMMAVFERTREIGMMRAVGMSKARVVVMVIIESGLVTALGLALGVLLSAVIIWLMGDGIDVSSFAGDIENYGFKSVLTPVMRLQDLVVPIQVGAITAILSSLWPALRAGRANPADALRQS